MSELLQKIRSRGHWRVIIRPATFVEKRVSNIANLYPILEKTSVQLRGWDFPHLDTRTQLHIDVDWIGQEIDWENNLELWRFYQSGQFVHLSGMEEDWYDQASWSPPYNGWKPRMVLHVEDSVFRFTEVFELAARLALTEAGDDQMHVEVTVARIERRTLWLSNSRRNSNRGQPASIDELPYTVDVSRTQLIAEPSELALKPAVELFRRFGWDPGLDVLRDIQGELLHRGRRVVGRS